MTVYLMHTAAWSLAGFLLGWLLGHLGRTVQEIGEVVAMTQEPPRYVAPRRSTVTWERAAGVVLVILAAVTLVTAAASARQLQAVTECQTSYNNALRDLLDQRSAATTRVRTAQREFITALSAPGVDTLDDARPALDRYRTAIVADADEREHTPVPAPPNCE